MTNMRNQDIETQLTRLKPRGAPGELRQHILSQLKDECQTRPKRKTSRLERITDIAVAALVLVAATAWIVNIRWQEHHFTSLLGPTPAQRQAERAIQSMQPAMNQDDLQSIREQLLVTLERAHRRTVNRSIHAVITLNIESIARREDDSENDREVFIKPALDTSYHRRSNQLDRIRTA